MSDFQDVAGTDDVDNLDTRVDVDDIGVNPTSTPTFREMVDARYSRRGVLKSLLAAAAATTLPPGVVDRKAYADAKDAGKAGAGSASTLTFTELRNVIDENHHVSPGYDAKTLIRWGDPVLPGAPAWKPGVADADGQARQFGYNNDFIAYMPLPAGADQSDASSHGLLCVSHEYVSSELIWPGVTDKMKTTEAQSRSEIKAHGASVVEVRKGAEGQWSVVNGSQFAKRITGDTPMVFSGPVAGHARLKSRDSDTGLECRGTLNNCAGGVTPWGTVLLAEENFHKYFSGEINDAVEAKAQARYGLPNPDYGWARYEERFDLKRFPREANRFGWVVEFDPYDPTSVPVKRTALGRFKHEGATVALNHDGRAVVYSGDDSAFEYVYKFVSKSAYRPDNPAANRNLLDDGVLYVAKFTPRDVKWLPLEFGDGPLTEANGFHSLADVMIETRRAADLVGATPMDRPEDVEPDPVSGRVYIALTNNGKRTESQRDATNRRAENKYGHIVEMLPPGSGTDAVNHGADTFGWRIFLQAGDPSKPDHDAIYHPDVTRHGWFACPDNFAFDQRGRLWISTDQGREQDLYGIPDGMRACDTDGVGRALTRLFFACPAGAEMCGPCFTPDGKTLFVAVQHPGESGRTKRSTYDDPITRWPDFDEQTPPRPSVVVITKQDGGEIGGA